ncbi:MAG: hypothetical protein HKN50_01765 [Gammaproteobacteria bacterium]|nr:hypothetical protein [Gammaproteobacteria bacterium]
MTDQATRDGIDTAFAKGDNAEGLRLLREFTESDQADAEAWHRLANVEEQIGSWARAGYAHHQCIQLAPDNPLAYLYAGAWLQKSNQPEAAAAVYSLLQDLNPRLLNDPRAGNANQQTALRARLANHHLRTFLSAQHRQLFSTERRSSRAARAKWTRTHDLPISHFSDQFAPELFYVPDLEQKPWFNASEFDWSAILESRGDQIRAELHQALNEHAEQLGIRPYLGIEEQYQDNLGLLAGSSNWSAIDLFRDGEPNTSLSELFPVTLETIQHAPTYGLDDQPYEVFFSMLAPGCSIEPHFGLSNHSLTCHLGIDIPNRGFLEVAGEKRAWQANRLLAFDDSYLHSAHNASAQRRIVLIFSIWHPSLTEEERAEIQRAFKTRQIWMAARREQLQLLLPEHRHPN